MTTYLIDRVQEKTALPSCHYKKADKRGIDSLFLAEPLPRYPI